MVVIDPNGQGPLPSPAILREYGAINPELPTLVVRQFVAQSTHRMELETLVTHGSERRMNRGQIFTFAVTAFGLGLSALVGIHGSALVASILAIVAIGGPTTAFVLARTFGHKTSDANALSHQ